MKRLETKWLLEGRTSADGPVISSRCIMHANNRHNSFSTLQGTQLPEKKIPIMNAAFKSIIPVIPNGRSQSGPIWTDLFYDNTFIHSFSTVAK
jgi:hypothetical protein